MDYIRGLMELNKGLIKSRKGLKIKIKSWIRLKTKRAKSLNY